MDKKARMQRFMRFSQRQVTVVTAVLIVVVTSVGLLSGEINLQLLRSALAGGPHQVYLHVFHIRRLLRALFRAGRRRMLLIAL
jgi:hypothetical protein